MFIYYIPGLLLVIMLGQWLRFYGGPEKVLMLVVNETHFSITRKTFLSKTLKDYTRQSTPAILTTCITPFAPVNIAGRSGQTQTVHKIDIAFLCLRVQTPLSFLQAQLFIRQFYEYINRARRVDSGSVFQQQSRDVEEAALRREEQRARSCLTYNLLVDLCSEVCKELILLTMLLEI